MDFSWNDEQKAVRDLARRILEDFATNERLKKIEASEERFDRELWGELARANLLGVAIGEAHGGSGLGLLALCLLLEEVGRTVAPVPVLPTLALGALPLERHGSEEQKRRWLPGVVRGETILTGALEEEGGDDALRPSTTARREGGGFRLSGRKVCVPAARFADRVVLAARSAGGAPGVFLLDPHAEGVRLEEQHTTDRQPHSLLLLDGAPAEPLGDPEAGAAILDWWTQRATTALCALQVGVSDRALAMTAEYTTDRIQFDRPIGSFQAVHQRAADAYIQLQGMRLTTWDAAWRLEAGESAPDAVAVAKYWAAEGGQFVGYAAQHLHGGIGIDVDYPMHRYYLWAKHAELTLGAAPVQIEHLGARLADGSLALEA